MASFFDDLKFVLNQLCRDWRFSVTCMACLALGMAAVATVFSLVNEVLLKRLPFPNPDQLVMVRAANYSNNRLNEHLTLPDYLDYRSQSKSFEHLAGYRLGRLDLPYDGGFERAFGFHISDNFFDLLQVQPFLGARLNQKRQRGNLQQIMIGTSLWKRRYGTKQDIVGDTIPINSWATWPNVGSRGYTVVGLLPKGLRCLPCATWFLKGGVGISSELPYCVPLNENRMLQRDYRDMEVIGRLKPGVSMQQAEAEMRLIAARLESEFPDTNADWTIRLIPLHKHVFGQAEIIIKSLFLASLLVLAIACGNAAHMMLVRFTMRLPEFAIQASVGATPFRLARQITIESLIVSAVSCIVSIALAMGWVGLLSTLAPPEIPRLESVSVDWRTIVFVSGIAVLCALMVVALPLRLLMTANLNQFLSLAGPTSSQGSAASRFTRNMVIAELAISYVLLVASGWVIFRMHALSKTDLGFDQTNRLSMSVSLPQAKHEWIQNTLFCNEVLRNARELPGVKNVAAIAGLPIGGNGFECAIYAEGRPDLRPDDLPPNFIRVITDDYFKTLGIPLIAGRHFNPSDSIGEIGANRTVIINKTLADQCWPDQNPVGRRIKTFPRVPWMEIVGLVGDVKSAGADYGPTSDIYYPEKLFPQPGISLVVHTEVDPLSLVKSVRQVVRDAGVDAYITEVKSLEQVVAESQAIERYALALVTGLAASGFLLALFGVFLTTSCSVSQRGQELKTRVACGATPADIIWLILRRSLFLTLVGLFCGLSCVAVLLVQQPSFGAISVPLLMSMLVIPIPLAVAAVLASLFVASRFAFARPSIR